MTPGKARSRNNLLKRIAITAVAFLFVGYFSVLALAYAFQDRLIFPQHPTSDRNPTDVGFAAYDNVTLQVNNFTTMAWMLPNDHARGTVLFSHGLGQTMAERLEMAKTFHDLGFGVFMYEYGGYWESTGEQSEQRCFDDVRAAWTYLTESKGVPPEKILVFGESMGTGPSVEIAHTQKPGALILLSPFTSLADVAQQRAPFLPVHLLLRHRFDNAAKIKQVTSPVLILHGVNDADVPFTQGESLFKLANEPNKLVKMAGCHDAYWIAQDKFKDHVSKFIDPLFPMNESNAR
jgi:alpha-beta hydrolase superfamily lysophospholipase